MQHEIQSLHDLQFRTSSLPGLGHYQRIPFLLQGLRLLQSHQQIRHQSIHFLTFQRLEQVTDYCNPHQFHRRKRLHGTVVQILHHILHLNLLISHT